MTTATVQSRIDRRSWYAKRDQVYITWAVDRLSQARRALAAAQLGICQKADLEM